MIVEFILVSVVAISPNQANTAFINKFTTSTACERAAQALRDGNVTRDQQERQFVCAKYDGGK